MSTKPGEERSVVGKLLDLAVERAVVNAAEALRGGRTVEVVAPLGEQLDPATTWLLIAPTYNALRLDPLVVACLFERDAPFFISVSLGKYGGADIRGIVMKGVDFEQWAKRSLAIEYMSPQRVRMYPIEGTSIQEAFRELDEQIRETGELRLAGDHSRRG